MCVYMHMYMYMHTHAKCVYTVLLFCSSMHSVVNVYIYICILQLNLANPNRVSPNPRLSECIRQPRPPNIYTYTHAHRVAEGVVNRLLHVRSSVDCLPRPCRQQARATLGAESLPDYMYMYLLVYAVSLLFVMYPYFTYPNKFTNLNTPFRS